MLICGENVLDEVSSNQCARFRLGHRRCGERSRIHAHRFAQIKQKISAADLIRSYLCLIRVNLWQKNL